MVGITCPSGYVSADRVDYAVTTLQQWGFNVKKGSTIGSEYHYFSGTDAERCADLQRMLDDPCIDAILMGRGGYGLSRIIDQLDFTLFQQYPKWICGFSDITVLHNHIYQNFGIATMHSPMCGAFKPDTIDLPHIGSFLAALTGRPVALQAPPSVHNRHGVATGIVTGGNLAILAHLTGSPSEVDTNGTILFIEDVSEYLYNIDRMLLNLKRAHKLHHLKALIAGGFTELQDTQRPFGKTVEEVIYDVVKEYDYPVCFNLPVGHMDVNYTLTLGVDHKLTIDEYGARLEQISP
jgi:muramoyltetrapeptide carboxypeptidase